MPIANSLHMFSLAVILTYLIRRIMLSVPQPNCYGCVLAGWGSILDPRDSLYICTWHDETVKKAFCLTSD